ncbi:MAG: sugar phosphate isomerase/epimerase family protein [Verrucomicrobiales bacterium]
MPERLAIHTITNKPWSTEQCIDKYAAAGVGGITFWRYSFDGRDPQRVGQQARDAGLEVVSVARGGFFPALAAADRQAAIDDNLRAIDEAAACGAPSLVLVCGAVPGQALAESRAQIRDGIAACLGHAEAAGVVLAIEPLHPMYADDRSAINTMSQASDLCEALGNHAHVGIACDVYHTWWDPDLENQVRRAAENGNFTAYHICDWLTPTTDFLNDRGLMGEGCINLAEVGSWVRKAGFSGYHEVEVFSDRHWSEDQDEYLNHIFTAYKNHS